MMQSKIIRRIMLLSLANLMAVQAQGQSTDWQVVKQLAPGTRISVKTRLRSICDFWVQERVHRG